MKLHLEVIGVILLLLSLIHIGFPKYFNWKADLKGISIINHQMMYMHTFFIGLVVLLMGVLCLLQVDDLISTPLGNTICLGLGIFWGLRLIVQLFGYSSVLWKRKKFETAIHIAFVLLWTYFTGIFLWIGFSFKI